MAARKTTRPSTAKKPAAPKKTTKKKAALLPDEAPVATPVVAPEVAQVDVAASPVVEEALRVSRTEFTQWIREAAFHLAQRRNFENGSPAQDWLQAEAYLTAQLSERGVSIVD